MRFYFIKRVFLFSAQSFHYLQLVKSLIGNSYNYNTMIYDFTEFCKKSAKHSNQKQISKYGRYNAEGTNYVSIL